VTLVVLLILAVIWSLYLASWMRNRAQVRSANSISSFNQHLSVLERARPAGVPTPVHPIAARTRASLARPHDPLVRPPQVRGLLSGPPITLADARRRRRQILSLLAVVTVVSFVPWLVLGGAFVSLAVAASTALVTYLFLLVRAQKLAEERYAKVRYLPTYAGYEVDDGAWDEYETYEPVFAHSH
jgi:cytochrome c-type biogenesis protein CcmH/NrfG